MAYIFGDGFDLYAAFADTVNGYWDSTAGTAPTLVAGRFAGSQGLQLAAVSNSLTKSSGVNDAVHHLVVAFRQTAAISGSTLGAYLQLLDGVTAQCTVVFRSDGAIVFAAIGPTGTVLATYTGAVTASNTWYAFEFEIVINNTTGAFRVRKNGNNVNDFDSGAVLDTQNSANAYANKLQIGDGSSAVSSHQIDDLFWRSDASSVAWMGDIRCYTRMPASDQSVQFSRTPTSATSVAAIFSANAGTTSTTAFYAPIVAAYDGTVGTVTALCGTGFTGNLKCSVFNSTTGLPSTIVASATTVTNPVTGTITFTFPTPFSVVRNTQYWIGLCADGSYASALSRTSGSTGFSNTTAVSYASFPVASPNTVGVLSAASAVISTWTIALSTNYQLVNEPQQDTTTSYVYDSTVNDADFYGIAAIASTPVSTIAVTTRGYMQKSDAGTRTAAVQLKSGASTVASPTLVLTTSGWLWAWRTDTTDPNTSAAWTAVAVNNAQVGPKVIA